MWKSLLPDLTGLCVHWILPYFLFFSSCFSCLQHCTSLLLQLPSWSFLILSKFSSFTYLSPPPLKFHFLWPLLTIFKLLFPSLILSSQLPLLHHVASSAGFLAQSNKLLCVWGPVVLSINSFSTVIWTHSDLYKVQRNYQSSVLDSK